MCTPADPLFNSLRSTPFGTSAFALQRLMHKTNAMMQSAATLAQKTHALQIALHLLQHQALAFQHHVAPCAFTYLCEDSYRDTPATWKQCSDSFIHVAKTALQSHNGVKMCLNWELVLRQWSQLFEAVSSGCYVKRADGTMGAKWVPRQAPVTAPYYGATVCMPSLNPNSVTERQFETRDECQTAVSQLPRQIDAVPMRDTVTCNQYGCYESVRWGRKPPYNLECTDTTESGSRCGPTLQMGSRV